MLKTILFDLDGTLLPMDQDTFIGAYMSSLARKMAPFGYDPQKLIQSIWQATGAMVGNDGTVTNETLFWQVFSSCLGKDVRSNEPVFLDFYKNEFQRVKDVCGFDPRAAETIHQIKTMGLELVLATNPLFPAIATHSRVRWAGLQKEDFSLITTYENSRHSKPNPDYYRDIMEILNLDPAACLMVGNDISEDMIARELGIRVFALTDCLINKANCDISQYPHGSFPELLDYIRSEL